MAESNGHADETAFKKIEETTPPGETEAGPGVSTAENGVMKVDLERADELKKLANQAFQENKFFRAAELYTEALEVNPGSAILWANRAFAHMKLEEYGSAVEDADKAIDCDPNYVKGYYRRGTAHLAMGKMKEALKDFRQAVRVSPKSSDARQKVRECDKAVKEQAFQDAIANPELGATASTSVDYTQMSVEGSYSGPRIGKEGITLQFVKEMLETFKNQKVIHRRYAFQILVLARDLLKAQPTLVDVDIADGSHITVCGDIHGQYYDLLNIFDLNGLPSDENPYLFNGDFVDRGSFSVECIFALLAFKVLYPGGLYLARGNHESKSMNRIYGFDGEVKSKYNDSMAELFSEVFCFLPLAHVLNSRIFVVHGGLFATDGVKLEDIRKVDRVREPPDEGLMCEMLWSDPMAGVGRSPSKRGVGVAFGADVTTRFLRENNLDLVVRSHEVKDEGYEEEHGGKLITVFSAPNYCDQMGNKGAFIRFTAPEMSPVIKQFSAVPHPSVRPMAYASMFSLLQ